MITCHLTKLELALDQIRKSHPKLVPADAALLSSALVLTGRHALADHNGQVFAWPDEIDGLARAILPEVELIQEAEPVKKSKNAPEEEPALINVALSPNLTAGEKLLGDRNDLKTKLSDILDEGVEFVYAQTDVGWQWALDHVNWNTFTTGEMHRRVKIKCQFTGSAVGVEMGATTAKRKKAKAAAVAETESVAEVTEEVHEDEA